MSELIYPDREDFEAFLKIIKGGNYLIAKYLPRTNEEWLDTVCDYIDYIKSTRQYKLDQDFSHCCAELLYKVAKGHSFGDGNKRSAVIVVFIFCILNDYFVLNPAQIKKQALRAAKSKGRLNEEMIKNRIAKEFSKEIKKLTDTLS